MVLEAGSSTWLSLLVLWACQHPTSPPREGLVEQISSGVLQSLCSSGCFERERIQVRRDVHRTVIAINLVWRFHSRTSSATCSSDRSPSQRQQAEWDYELGKPPPLPRKRKRRLSEGQNELKTQSSSLFLSKLPAEIRLQIYEHTCWRIHIFESTTILGAIHQAIGRVRRTWPRGVFTAG